MDALPKWLHSELTAANISNEYWKAFSTSAECMRLVALVERLHPGCLSSSPSPTMCLTKPEQQHVVSLFVGMFYLIQNIRESLTQIVSHNVEDSELLAMALVDELIWSRHHERIPFVSCTQTVLEHGLQTALRLGGRSDTIKVLCSHLQLPLDRPAEIRFINIAFLFRDADNLIELLRAHFLEDQKHVLLLQLVKTRDLGFIKSILDKRDMQDWFELHSARTQASLDRALFVTQHEPKTKLVCEYLYRLYLQQ